MRAKLEFEPGLLGRSYERRQMTSRGRATIAIALLFLGMLAGFAFWPEGSAPRLAAVSAAPPEQVPPALLERLPPGARGSSVEAFVLGAGARTIEQISLLTDPAVPPQAYEVEYTVDPLLSGKIEAILRRGRVALGHVLLMDIEQGELLAYESTDPTRFPGTRSYPMASLMKVVTAAALLRERPEAHRRSCHFVGSPYRLTRPRLDPPTRGHQATLERALATSNNQCFAQYAVHDLGFDGVAAEAARTGLVAAPGPGHDAGFIERSADRLDLGRLGSGLDGSYISPLAALRLAAALADGELVEARWLRAVRDNAGNALPLPAVAQPQRIWSPDVTERLRSMLIQTTERGTARRAFRDRRGNPLLGPVRVAGKTGSLRGDDPKGRYEWFVGVAPADNPKVAIATLVVNGDLWWRSASQIAADALKTIFCEQTRCDGEIGAAHLARARDRGRDPAPPSLAFAR